MSQPERTRRRRTPAGQRRSAGEGTITFNAERDRYEGRVELDPGRSGRRVRKKVTGRTRAEVAAKLDQLRNERAAGLDIAARPTVEYLARLWLTVAAPTKKSPATMSRVVPRVEQHLIPAIGHHRVKALTVRHVESWLAAEAAAGAAKSTISAYRGDLRQVLELALRDDLVLRNVAAGAYLPHNARPPQERNSLTEDQAADLLDALDGDRLGPFFAFLLTLGLRPGEAHALTWDSFDGDAIIISAALRTDNAGRPFDVGPTKSKQTRTAALPPPLARALHAQRAQQRREQLAAGPAWSTEWAGHVFLNELGRPLNPSNVRRSLAAACARAGVPRISPYELRHSAASQLIAMGVAPFEVADLLGHSDLRMLERHYRHRLTPIAGASNALADRLEAAQSRRRQEKSLAR